MESKLFSIGDVVAFKTHPYNEDLTDIILSGDHISLSPLLVVTGVFKAKSPINQTDATFKYTCSWFSPKPYKFLQTDILQDDLKLIAKSRAKISPENIKRGDRLVLKTGALELGKKKSSVSFDQSNSTSNKLNTTINSLLSFLPPIVQVLEVTKHVNQKPIVEKKTNTIIRSVHEWEVRFSFFDPQTDKISEHTLPLDIFDVLEDIDIDKLTLLRHTISLSGYLAVKEGEVVSVVKPILLSCRLGHYFLSGFNFLTNQTTEFNININTNFKVIKSPFSEQVPTFDIISNPISVTPAYITNEIIAASEKASKENFYIRIKYKNRNEKLSIRTIGEYQIVKVNEGNFEVAYLVGHCLLRKAKRSFRVDRIQFLQILVLKFH